MKHLGKILIAAGTLPSAAWVTQPLSPIGL